jgi:hypothetical protein
MLLEERQRALARLLSRRRMPRTALVAIEAVVGRVGEHLHLRMCIFESLD